jgi:(E)-4-hydroxy-3-methylbut-2-enyl-diphosphate synthase
MRIGTNHGSLSDRIMSRYGDTAIGMVESAMEFLRIARSLDYHQIILSMKSSNPQVMVQAYRLLIQQMHQEFNELYPLHLGVTEAGDGEDGRIKSAIGIGTLLEDGIGDTIRVSLTEDPELEIPVCVDLVKRYNQLSEVNTAMVPELTQLPYSPFEYTRRATTAVRNIGGKQVPVVIADLSHLSIITTTDLVAIGYTYDAATDKWTISDAAADYVFIGNKPLDFNLPGTLSIVATPAVCALANNTEKYHPIIDAVSFIALDAKHPQLNFVQIDCYSDLQPIADELLLQISKDPSVVFCLSSQCNNAMQAVRRMAIKLMQLNIKQPIILVTDSQWQTTDEHLIHFAIETGALFLEGIGDGISLGLSQAAYDVSVHGSNVSGRNYFNNSSIEQLLNTTAFGILQATRTRISKTEYISCPSCGRTLFELQETTAKIRAVTNHLKGLKIAIMGCIVNGPGEMADADFGYVGSGVGKITLYKGKEVMKRNIDSNVAVDELIVLLKEHNAWIEPSK